MFLTVVQPLEIPDALLLSLVGFLVVFFVLIVLMLVIKIITAAVGALEKKPEPAAAQASAPPPLPPKADPNAGKVPAPGSLGECDLHSVPDATAALLMAIVADEMQTPLNELRFLSIQEIQEDKKK